jgi:hypothetical protein
MISFNISNCRQLSIPLTTCFEYYVGGKKKNTKCDARRGKNRWDNAQ